MRVFVAGGSGTIGVPLVRALVAAGHDVTALTRSIGKRTDLLALGASVAVADALDRPALAAAVAAASPTHVIHQLTALPKDGPRKAGDITATNRLRVEGTRNLLDAAVAAGARRFVAGSFALLAPRDSSAGAPSNDAAAAVAAMEDQVLRASARGLVEGVVLRYGMFYGPGTPSTRAMIDLVRQRRLPVVRDDRGRLPLVHLDDAVAATVLALDAGPAGAVYDIVDDRAVSMTEIAETLAAHTGAPRPFRVPAWLPRLVAPYLAGIMSIQMPLSNDRAKAGLGWRPRYPTMEDGMAAMFRRVA
ncbi:MAG: NAD-dependent epimerase/dehydratase family protein [Vicinamibacterales bacterium]